MAVPKLVVFRDTREKRPLIFPPHFEWCDIRGERYFYKVEVEDQRLETADYIIKGYEGVVGVERKGSIREVFNNLCGKDRKRFCQAITRLQTSFKHPILALDVTLNEWYEPVKHVDRPEMVHDILYRELIARRIELMWLPRPTTHNGRLRQGDALLRRMWSYIVMEKGA